MTWKLTTYGKTRAGVPGVPWRDLSDEEFAAAEALFAPGVLRAREYFEHVPDEPERQIASAGTSPYFEHEPSAEPTPSSMPSAVRRGSSKGASRGRRHA